MGRKPRHIEAENPRNIIRRVNRARRFPTNTCPASRYVQMIGEAFARGKSFAAVDDDREDVGVALLSVVESLYKARNELAALKAKARP